MDYAKSGFVVTENVTIPAGPLADLQSTMEPVLRKLGLPTKLEKGTIVLRKDHVVCTEGARLTPEQATILKHLGKPMSEFKITILCMWSKDGTFEQYKKFNTPSKLKKPIEPKPTKQNKSKKPNKKRPKASANEDNIDTCNEYEMADNNSRDGGGGNDKLNSEKYITEDKESNDDKEEGIVEDHSEDSGEERSDEHKPEDERMDEDDEMDEDEGMHEDEDDGILYPNSEDIGKEIKNKTEEEVYYPTTKIQTNTPSGNKTPNQSATPLETSSKKKSHKRNTPKQNNTTAHTAFTPRLIGNQPQETEESSQEQSDVENVNRGNQLQETDESSQEQSDVENVNRKSNYFNKNSPLKMKSSKLARETEESSQEATGLSEENITSQEESEPTLNIEDTLLEHSQNQGKTPNKRTRKDSTSKKSQKYSQKDEENKKSISASNPSPKITRSNPRRSMRTPKPAKRTPPNETKPSDLVTGSAKRLRTTPLKGTPQTSKDTPKRTAKRKSIFPGVSEDIEMK